MKVFYSKEKREAIITCDSAAYIVSIPVGIDPAKTIRNSMKNLREGYFAPECHIFIADMYTYFNPEQN